MLKRVFILLLIALALLLIYVALQPAEYTISRQTAINATAEQVFPYINESKKMNAWNPWTELDPKAKIAFSGPDEGVGSITSWFDGEKLGTGKATIIESIPNSLVKTKLEYTEPYPMIQQAVIDLSPQGNQIIVKWSVSGRNSFLGRLMCFFMNMDKMIGGTFEKGLSKLKMLLESKN